MEEYARIERISQGTDNATENLHDLYEEASAVAGRVLESVQAIAGTAACKGVQIAELEKWAKVNMHWIEDPNALGTYADRGSENEVYVSHDGREVIKLNDFRYSDDNLKPFFNRIQAHNQRPQRGRTKVAAVGSATPLGTLIRTSESYTAGQ